MLFSYKRINIYYSRRLKSSQLNAKMPMTYEYHHGINIPINCHDVAS